MKNPTQLTAKWVTNLMKLREFLLPPEYLNLKESAQAFLNDCYFKIATRAWEGHTHAVFSMSSDFLCFYGEEVQKTLTENGYGVMVFSSFGRHDLIISWPSPEISKVTKQ